MKSLMKKINNCCLCKNSCTKQKIFIGNNAKNIVICDNSKGTHELLVKSGIDIDKYIIIPSIFCTKPIGTQRCIPPDEEMWENCKAFQKELIYKIQPDFILISGCSGISQNTNAEFSTASIKQNTIFKNCLFEYVAVEKITKSTIDILKRR